MLNAAQSAFHQRVIESITTSPLSKLNAVHDLLETRFETNVAKLICKALGEEGPERNLFVVDSAGGTGKTYTINKIVQDLRDLPENPFGIGMRNCTAFALSPTQATKRVLIDACFPGNAETAFAKAVLDPSWKKSSGQWDGEFPDIVNISSMPDYKIKTDVFYAENTIVVFDEISMIKEAFAARIIDALFEAPFRVRACVRATVVFVGDSAQMPPVHNKSLDSPLFYFLRQYLHGHQHMELTENVRAKNMSPQYMSFLSDLRGRILKISRAYNDRQDMSPLIETYNAPVSLLRGLLNKLVVGGFARHWPGDYRDMLVQKHWSGESLHYVSYSNRDKNRMSTTLAMHVGRGHTMTYVGQSFEVVYPFGKEYVRPGTEFVIRSDLLPTTITMPINKEEKFEVLASTAVIKYPYFNEGDVFDVHILMNRDHHSIVSSEIKILKEYCKKRCNRCKKIIKGDSDYCPKHLRDVRKLRSCQLVDPRFSTIYGVQGRSVDTLVLNAQDMFACLRNSRDSKLGQEAPNRRSTDHPGVLRLVRNLHDAIQGTPPLIPPTLFKAQQILKAMYVSTSRPKKELVLVKYCERRAALKRKRQNE